MTSTSSSSSLRIRPNDGGPDALPVVEPVRERHAREPPRLLAPADPARVAQPVPEVDEVRDPLPVLLAALHDVVGGEQPVRRAGHAPVALEARADERLVREVRAGEQVRDPLEELRLGHRPGRRQEAVDRPLDPVRERRRGGVAVGPVAEPPAVVADLRQAAAVGPLERVADEGDEPLDVVDGLASGRRRRRRGIRVALHGRRPDEAAQVARPVEADEDLADEPGLGHGLAAELEHVDGGLEHGARRVLRRERRVRRPARPARTAAPRARGPGRRRRRAAGRARRSPGSAGPRGSRPSPAGRAPRPRRSSRPASGSRAAASR